MKTVIFIFLILCATELLCKENILDLEIFELLGLADGPKNFKAQQLSSSNSASRFLREVYSEISNEGKKVSYRHRWKRGLSDDNFITNLDRTKMEKCNNLITFSSKTKTPRHSDFNSSQKYLHLLFNMNDIPIDLKLVHSTLRIYHNPIRNNRTVTKILRNATITVYEKSTFQFGKDKPFNKYRIVTSLNMTTQYKGWLEFNITRLLSRWLNYKKFPSVVNGSELIVDATLYENDTSLEGLKLGLVRPIVNKTSEHDPFIIGYFNGPQLFEKLKKLRSKREIFRNKRKTTGSLYFQLPEHHPKTCERLNFTVDFKDTMMSSWVIAPRKFEAYFCGGDCNFPLGAHMNATNHAIVQTLMQLKKPHLPKPCCAPTALESITMLYYINGDNINLVKFPKSVVKECGCL